MFNTKTKCKESFALALKYDNELQFQLFNSVIQNRMSTGWPISKPLSRIIINHIKSISEARFTSIMITKQVQHYSTFVLNTLCVN